MDHRAPALGNSIAMRGSYGPSDKEPTYVLTGGEYPKYKPSGVEWLGEVPEHWEVTPLYFLSLSYGRIVSKDISSNDGLLPDSFETYQIVRPGDIVFRLTDLQNDKRSLRSAIVEETGIITSAYLTVKPSGPNSEYMNYLFRAYDVTKVFYSMGGGLRQSMKFADLKRMPTLLPPSPEQTRIAAFLDAETAKIDELVAEQRRLMDLLKEKRQAVISHAVTKGLNPNAPMKSSGIEWLGDVPEHWEVMKMKWVAEMESGHTPDKKVAEYWENGDIPWVSLNDTGFLKDNDYISDTAYTVSQLGIDNSSARLLPARVVVFSRDATIGRCAITTRPMAVSQHFIAWVCGQSIIPEFLLLRLRSMTRELDRLTTGATLKTIGMPDVRTIVTPVPPLEEQRAIINWVANETAKIDTLTAEAQRAIDLLQERRTALISAAVTGQIDVRTLPARPKRPPTI
jgi:type I restriction enzyme S subunit